LSGFICIVHVIIALVSTASDSESSLSKASSARKSERKGNSSRLHDDATSLALTASPSSQSSTLVPP